MAFKRIFVVGNLGRDPELRYTPNGRPVTEFSVASNNSKPDGNGGWIDDGTDWFRVTVWGDQAERAADELKKGMKVLVAGRFRSREYEDKEHRTRVSMEITSDQYLIIDDREGGSTGSGFHSPEFNSYSTTPPGQQPVQPTRQPQGQAFRGRPSDDDLDDLPF